MAIDSNSMFNFLFSFVLQEGNSLVGAFIQDVSNHQSIQHGGPGRPRPGKLVQTGGSPLICRTFIYRQHAVCAAGYFLNLRLFHFVASGIKRL